MNRISLLAASVWLLAAPAWAGTLQIYEGSLGSPGVTAVFAPGSGLVGDIDYDASTAESGGLLFGASEITIVPTGDAVLVAFACQVSGCTADDYEFVAGGAGVGSLVVNDPTDLFPNPMTGVFELGDLTWDSLIAGSLQLTGCNYTDSNGPPERTCDPFTVATTVPEPGTGALVGFALAALGIARRRR